MYTITFYSFKGGVGRTLALANVGAELALRGKRVLLVDFDLEAPGLDTFDSFRAPMGSLGIVDFVASYLETGAAPAVEDHIYRTEIGTDHGGELWVMPTGNPNREYGVRFNSIDWQALYVERDGFFLIEDLKAQWEKAIRPDYVLIDSRTGHTDVAGICTRQLPDAVALLFFPNEQNRRGLAQVVDEIRDDEAREGRKQIELFFVAANLPDLDDEDGLLKKRLRMFRTAFGGEQLHARIYHYGSLALLEQSIFTVSRPKTKLAKQYRQLTDVLTERNLADRQVALRVLEMPPTTRLPRTGRFDDILSTLQQLHYDDGEVVYRLAQANRWLGREESASQLVDRACQLGFESEETLFAAAAVAYSETDPARARELIVAAIRKPQDKLFSPESIFTVVQEWDPDFLEELALRMVARSRAWQHQLYVSKILMSSVAGARVAEGILRELREGPGREGADSQLVLCLICVGKCEEAMRLIARERGDLADMGISDNFNYAMAEWAHTQAPPVDLFERVIWLHQEDRGRKFGSNYYQCLAIAAFAVGNRDAAKSFVNRAVAQVGRTPRSFSGWSYLELQAREFESELQFLRAAIDAGAGTPAVVERNAAKPT